jgi:hypothetical protein
MYDEKFFNSTKEAESKVLNIMKHVPSMEVFFLLLLAFKNAGKLQFERCEVIFERMSRHEMNPDTALMNVMVSACEPQSLWRKAITVVKDMKKRFVLMK